MNSAHISASKEYLLPGVKFFSYCNGNGAVLVGTVPAALMMVGAPPLVRPEEGFPVVTDSPRMEMRFLEVPLNKY